MKVVIAEDNGLLRDGVRLVLVEAGFEVVAGVDNADELLQVVQNERPDLAIIDVRMPPSHTDEGIRAALKIRQEHVATAVLVFSQWVETKYARELIAADTSKCGYLLKDRVLETDEFIAAVRRVADGGTALDPEVVRQLLSGSNRDDGLARLSEREHDVLRLVAEGRSNQAISEQLFLAIRSVEKVIATIFMKLDLPQADSDHRRVLAVLRYLSGG